MIKAKRIIILFFLITCIWLLAPRLISFFQSFNSTPAPKVSFTTITGKVINLSELKGKPVIVTFWATDCANCIKEIPHFVELYNEFHPRGLEIIAVTMYYDKPSHVVAMTKAKQLPYDVALDLKAEHAKAFGQVQLTPATFLISPSGNIVMQKMGLLDIVEMKQQLEELLG